MFSFLKFQDIFYLYFQSRSPVEMNFSLDASKAQRELIGQLEMKNR